MVRSYSLMGTAPVTKETGPKPGLSHHQSSPADDTPAGTTLIDYFLMRPNIMVELGVST